MLTVSLVIGLLALIVVGCWRTRDQPDTTPEDIDAISEPNPYR